MTDNNDFDMAISEGKWRVKLYHLNYEGKWLDIGTGFVFITKKVCL